MRTNDQVSSILNDSNFALTRLSLGTLGWLRSSNKVGDRHNRFQKSDTAHGLALDMAQSTDQSSEASPEEKPQGE